MTNRDQIITAAPVLVILALAGLGGYALSAKATPPDVVGYLQDPNSNNKYASSVALIYKSRDDKFEAERIALAGGLYNARGKFTIWRIEPLLACSAPFGSKILISGSGTIEGTVYSEHQYRGSYIVQWDVSDVTIIDGPKAGCKGTVESKFIKQGQ